jgi:16S rRNA (cytosine967-C5)-methyltransferase
VKPRDLALAALNRAEHSPGHPERYLEQAFQQDPSLTKRDRSLTVYLVQGVLRWRLRLDWVIHRSVRFPFRNITPPVLNILRIAVYQILFMDRIPDSAAVNEAVKQAKAGEGSHVVSFVNGILRDICRKKNEENFPDRDKYLVRFLSVFYSYPEWLVKKWMRELGMVSAERLLEAGNRLPTLVVRTNRLKISRQDLIRYLTDEGIEARPTPYSPEGTEIKGLGGPIQEMEAFRSGLFQVQGEAAQICSQLISPKPGECILDLCAGLGGKSTHMAELMGNEVS